MNYKNLAYRELGKLLDENPEYTFGECLYSFIRLLDNNVNRISTLTETPDEEIYTSISKTIEDERAE